MLKNLIVIKNVLEPDEWDAYEVDSISEKLASLYPTFPDTARLYHESVSLNHDITPCDEYTVRKLEEYEGTIYCVVYPSGPAIPVGYLVAALVVAVVAAAFLLKPNIPSANTENKNKSSSNNELSERTNEPRLNKRVPDIYGKLRSTPDMLTVPYIRIENNQDVESCTLCVGRGSYEFYDFLDDTSDFDEVSGNSAQIYEPFSDIVNDNPSLVFGNSFRETLYNVEKSSSVTGQTLLPPNTENFNGNSNVYFQGPSSVVLQGSDEDFTDYFQAGDVIVISNSVSSKEGENPDSYNGTYTVISISSNVIVLDDPATVNSNWNNLSGGQKSKICSANIFNTSEKWVGPFTLTMPTRNRVMANVVCPSGLFQIGKDTGKQFKATVTVTMEVTPVNSLGQQVGDSEYVTGTIVGSATTRDQAGITLEIVTSFKGRCKVRLRRTSLTKPNDNTWTDITKVRDLYAVEEIGAYSYGDVTVIRTKTYATAGALSLKARKLNTLVCRKLPRRISGNIFSTDLFATSDMADIISSMALDPVIGNRSVNEIDFDSIYKASNDVSLYFGTNLASQFSYTFDDYTTSFEESVSQIAEVCFCQIYRQGNKIKLFFEKKTEDSILLFNHRNKIPGTEKRTVSFGTSEEFDGLTLSYTSPDDDSQIKYYIPADQSAVNPKTIEAFGIRSKIHAHLYAYRKWNKLKYNNVSVEFEATNESDILINYQRFLNADNTRPYQQDGEIKSVDGLELFCSQPVTFEEGKNYNIFLQLADGTIESIPVYPGRFTQSVIIERAPRIGLVTGNDVYARTTYIIVGNESNRQMAFLMTEKEPQESYTNTITGINYTEKYYQNDNDYTNGLITED